MNNDYIGNGYQYLNKDSDRNVQYTTAVPVSKRVYAYDVNSAGYCAPGFANQVDSLPVGMGYVPWQMWNEDVFDADTGHEYGTIFPELVKPFICTPCMKLRGGR